MGAAPLGYLGPARARRVLLGVLVIALAASLAFVPAIRTGGPLPPASHAESVIGGAGLVLLSLLGTGAAVRPSGCNRMIRRAGTLGPASPAIVAGRCTSRRVLGHHPDCGRFSGHTLRIAGRLACAGCTGMALGGALGAVLGLVLMAGGFPGGQTAAMTAAILGAGGAVAGLAGAGRPGASPGGRVLAGFALVAGCATLATVLCTIGVPEGAFGLGAAVAVVGLRVDLSRLLHGSICLDCSGRSAAMPAGGVAGGWPTGR